MTELHSKTYGYPLKFLKYSEGKIIAFLNEEVVNDYVAQEGDEPTIGYKYTGTEEDGGTILACANPDNRDDVINAIIRSKYSETEEFSIHRHHLIDPDNYVEEWERYNDFVEQAKALYKKWTTE